MSAMEANQLHQEEDDQLTTRKVDHGLRRPWTWTDEHDRMNTKKDALVMTDEIHVTTQ